MILNLFNEQFKIGQSHRVVCVAPLEQMEPVWPLDAISAEFGGHIMYENAFKQRFVGVWGRRNTDRFRHQLTERGFVIDVIESPPDNARLLVRAVRRV
ncbi:hypothetical protein GCM10011494_17880 [Novosphingobium endophyticum]|uniref:Uncharacterized protein n=1 Tax=Novosphingobium endophyticum TaxID=1955250 RepID=A0A916TRU6_9SPHN|nr:hypothetical protein [Novosphingobium endophyticum]GGB99820.1 hypothetical protein GCM10011494_17880 [Novosphingobium endophyticum]